MGNKYVVYGFQGWNPSAQELAEIDAAMNQSHHDQQELVSMVMADEMTMDAIALAIYDVKRKAVGFC